MDDMNGLICAWISLGRERIDVCMDDMNGLICAWMSLGHERVEHRAWMTWTV